jgi:hypothetical protein
MSSLGMHQLTKEATTVPKMAVGLLLGILVFGMFMVGFDQGSKVQVLSWITSLN